ncbi:MAG: beta-lactamase family protein [Treponema sp.]|jgi:CubicO group peptidase (beta-lactamase class C family)|nr:beta-lactamase family protein [Treponema sp.]
MDFSKLSAYLDSFYREKNIPGVGCAVYHRHTRVYEHYAGFSDVENKVPFGPSTVFHLYSATKLVTASAVLQLCEAGRCALGDPLADYIPEYRHIGVRLVGPDGRELIRPAQNPLTIEHLLSMQGGVGTFDAEPVRRVIQETDGRAPTLAVVRAAATEPLLFEPGTRFRYSMCFDVLGGLVEVVSGQRFGVYLKEHIFEPLGMKDTGFEGPADPERLARDYIGFNAATGRALQIGENIAFKLGSDYECGGGGLYSTVPDYILFAAALCNGGLGPGGRRILQKETVADMATNRLFGEPAADFAAFGGPSKTGYGYGLGVRVLVDPEQNNALSAQGEFGWDGARGCYVLVDPAEEVAIFYAQQESGSQWWHWHGTVRNYVYASLWPLLRAGCRKAY